MPRVRAEAGMFRLPVALFLLCLGSVVSAQPALLERPRFAARRTLGREIDRSDEAEEGSGCLIGNEVEDRGYPA